jgi:DNA-binding FadR family transcriptional regulator
MKLPKDARMPRPRARGPEIEIRPIRVPKTSEIVADHFRGQIVRGELCEGDFLPPEGQLIESLGISRPTLREAFRIIEAEKLISVVRGSRTGARVHKPQIESVSRYAGYVLQAHGTTIADIFEVRMAIEPYVVRQLALKKNKKAIARLREEIERLTILANDARFIEFMTEVAEFHRILVDVAGNRTLHFLTQMLQHLLARTQVEIYKRTAQPKENQRKSSLMGVRSMTKLVDLIEAGDASAAAAHWELHLSNANRRWTAGADGVQVVDALG